ncbi:MAG TPA: S41 family peptidase, partial [Symbiobacteriaceae bacterium]|nr:S41 family peptidase [Symbiobacteriaceae bacterium]
PMYCGATDAWALPRPWLTVPEEPVQPDATRPRYSGPVAVLTSFVTYSAAENFCAVFRNSRRGPLVGDPTGGSTGQPAIFPLPGGGFGAVCAKQTTFMDGTPLVGVGIVPDIPVAPTIKALAEGRDLVLERALEALGS